jgi:hypothetical protein
VIRKLVGTAAVAGAVALAGPASATELWTPHLPGVDIGLAAGALPPPGVYGVLNNYWATYSAYNSKGNAIPNASLEALVEVPIVLWSTGYKVLGADYAVAIAQPFDYTSVGSGFGLPTGSGNWGTYNTVLIPGQLSWTFDEFHVLGGVSVYLPTATSTPAGFVTGKWLKGGLPSGNGYWAIQPDLGLSWLHDGWNLSASLHLPIPVDATTATNYSYQSGVLFQADYTATKTIGKWTLGVGGYQVNQLNADTCSGSACAALGAPKKGTTRFGLGPILGYQFGGINIQLTVAQSVITRNDVGGTFANVRFIVPF